MSAFASGLAAAGTLIVLCACDVTGPSNASPTIRVPAAPANDGPAPALTAVLPNTGSTTGGTPVVITGSGLLTGVTATFDGVPVEASFDSRFKDRIFLSTPPHAAGAVAVVVTNPGGRPGRLDAGYTYAAPGSFDFDGIWSGFPMDGSDLEVDFTIRDHGLVRVSCDTFVLELSPPVPVRDGAFSLSRDGSAMTGRIVSASQAVGTIALGRCNAPHWEAAKATGQ